MIQDGSLVVQSLERSNSVFVTCRNCEELSDHYYLQADFTTDTMTDTNFGFIFQLIRGPTDNSFYVYTINAERQVYFFYDHTRGHWLLLASGLAPVLRLYPSSNTLGLYVYGNSLEFYINGDMIDTYEETNVFFGGGLFGFYLDDAGPQLNVRNALVYMMK